MQGCAAYARSVPHPHTGGANDRGEAHQNGARVHTDADEHGHADPNRELYPNAFGSPAVPDAVTDEHRIAHADQHPDSAAKLDAYTHHRSL